MVSALVAEAELIMEAGIDAALAAADAGAAAGGRGGARGAAPDPGRRRQPLVGEDRQDPRDRGLRPRSSEGARGEAWFLVPRAQRSGNAIGVATRVTRDGDDDERQAERGRSPRTGSRPSRRRSCSSGSRSVSGSSSRRRPQPRSRTVGRRGPASVAVASAIGNITTAVALFVTSWVTTTVLMTTPASTPTSPSPPNTSTSSEASSPGEAAGCDRIPEPEAGGQHHDDVEVDRSPRVAGGDDPQHHDGQCSKQRRFEHAQHAGGSHHARTPRARHRR